MTTQYDSPGDTLTMPAPVGGVTHRTPIVIGELFLLPAVDEATTGELVAMRASGVWRVPKATGFACVAGETIAYWDVADEEVNTDTGNPAVGVIVEDAASGDTECLVKVMASKWINATAAAARLTVLEAGQYAGQSLEKMLTADGTQKGATVNDTYVDFTEDALQFSANAVEDNDTIEWEAEIKIDAMNAAGSATGSLKIGSLEVDAVTLATADTNDWLKLKGTARFTAVGASSTLEVFGGEGCGSDGGSVTRDTPTYTGGATGPATTSAVVFTLRWKAATGHAGNLATVKNFKIKLSKAA